VANELSRLKPKRAGVTGHNVRYVLAFSLIGIIAVFIVIYFLFFG
jgi:hypothetical protein